MIPTNGTACRPFLTERLDEYNDTYVVHRDIYPSTPQKPIPVERVELTGSLDSGQSINIAKCPAWLPSKDESWHVNWVIYYLKCSLDVCVQ